MVMPVQRSPEYASHRVARTAVDSLPVAVKDLGINLSNYEYAHVQIVPSGGADPTAAVLWWSEAATKFVQEHTAISKAGVGANTPFEFTVECRGRIMLVALTTLTSGTVSVYVSGFNLSHPE